MSINRRLRLYKQNPHCYWCGELCEYHTMAGGGKNEPNEATIDHLYSRLDPRRPQNPGAYVLAHARCNQKRADIEIEVMKQVWGIVAPVLLGDKVLTLDPDPEIVNRFQKIWPFPESTF